MWDFVWYSHYLGVTYALIALGVLVVSHVTKTYPIPFLPILASILIGFGITFVDYYSFSRNTGLFMAGFVVVTLFFIYRAKTAEIRMATILDIVAALAFLGISIRIVLNPYMIHSTFFKGLAIVVALNALAYVIPRTPAGAQTPAYPSTI